MAKAIYIKMASSSQWKCLFILFSFIVCRMTVEASLTLKPSDTEAMVGERAYLKCSTNITDKEIHWNHLSVQTERTRKIYSFEIFLNNYSHLQMDKSISQGSYTLIFPIVERKDAGRYTCQDKDGVGDHEDVELIVLERNITGSSNIREDGLIGPNNCGFPQEMLQLSCSVTYYGRIPPILRWKKVGQEIVLPVTNHSTGREVTYNLTIPVNSSFNNSSFVCETTRASGVQYKWISPIVKILSDKSSYTFVRVEINETANCSLSSSHVYSFTDTVYRYTWKKFEGKTSSTTSQKQVLIAKSPGFYWCEVEWSIGNRKHSVVAMYAYVAEPTESPKPSGSLSKANVIYQFCAYMHLYQKLYFGAILLLGLMYLM